MSKLHGINILVVDDDPDLRELVSDEFTMEGAIVMSAESGKVAVGLLEQNRFDVVISDMRMPNGDGRFVSRSILEMKSPKPILFIYSGYNDLTDEESSKLEIKEIFSKPFVLSDIVNSIHYHHERKNII